MSQRCHRQYKYFIRTLKKIFFLMKHKTTKCLRLESEHLGMWKVVNGNQEQTCAFFSQHCKDRCLAGPEISCLPLPAPGGKEIPVESKTCKTKHEESYVCMHRVYDRCRAGSCSCSSWYTFWSSCMCIIGLAVVAVCVFVFQVRFLHAAHMRSSTLALWNVLWSFVIYF